MPFTPEELAELAAFDAMIDDEPITAEEYEASRQRDLEAKFSALDNRTARRARKASAYQRAYYAKHKDERAADQRAYYAEHKDERAAYQRAYYAEHKDELAAYHRAYAAEHKDELAAYQRAYAAEHKDERAAYQRAYYAEHKDEIAAAQRAYYAEHKDERAAYQRAYRAEHKDERAADQRAYYYTDRPTLDDLRARRKRLNLSQADIAQRIGCSRSLVCMLENGRVTQADHRVEAYLAVLDLFESTGTAGDA